MRPGVEAACGVSAESGPVTGAHGLQRGVRRKVTRSPHSDVAWLEPRRYCWVPVATKVTSSDALP